MGATTTPNVELLRRTLAHIEANPETWNQETWRRVTDCGTAMCFAGWAAQLAGGMWYRDGDVGFDSRLIAEPNEPGSHSFSGDQIILAQYRAERVLGLTDDQAEELFDSNNTLNDLRRIVADICAAAGAAE